MSTEFTEFQRLVMERYPLGDNTIYEEKGDYMWLIDGPLQYENELEILKYAKENPNATLRQLNEYWDHITPDGLPPCASEWPHDDDD